MALLQNCLNLSGQEEEGEDGIKVLNLSNLSFSTYLSKNHSELTGSNLQNVFYVHII